MTKDEIKQQNKMCEVVERYGFRPNRAGFIPCPFHKGDREASMKIYADSFYCFGCGANGDIFSFVQRMDCCDFKTAFYVLGGTYEKPTFKSRLAVYKQHKKAEERQRRSEKLSEKRRLTNMLIDIYRDYMERSEPYSDVWCDCCNALFYQLYIHEILSEKR